ncbi:MAG: TIGR00282 family metallophosphoesterase [Parvibaculales bacterium]
MKILFFGDVVGRRAREELIANLPDIRRGLEADFVAVNGENAAGGFGITEDIATALYDAGVDVITLGNHAWDQRETLGHIAREPRLLRPANYPAGTPGQGVGFYQTDDGHQIVVITLLGQLFMETLEDPFARLEQELSVTTLGENADAVIVEIHGEATSEKMGIGHFCDGRASMVVGSHTHIPTADAQILPGGTAYQSDLGMCGDYDSVIGMEKDEPLYRFTTKMRRGRFTPALETPTLCGALVTVDPQTGLAQAIEPVRLGGRLSATHDF